MPSKNKASAAKSNQNGPLSMSKRSVLSQGQSQRINAAAASVERIKVENLHRVLLNVRACIRPSKEDQERKELMGSRVLRGCCGGFPRHCHWKHWSKCRCRRLRTMGFRSYQPSNWWRLMGCCLDSHRGTDAWQPR